MPAGDYRHRIRFEANTPTKASDGQRKDGWNPIGTTPEVWAEKRALRGTEGLDAATLLTQRPYQWRTHYRTDITTEHRLVEIATGDVHDIEFVGDPDGKRKEIEILTVATDGA